MIHGPFAVGIKLSVTPAGSDEALTSTIAELVDGEVYADRTNFSNQNFASLMKRPLQEPFSVLEGQFRVGSGQQVPVWLLGNGASEAGGYEPRWKDRPASMGNTSESPDGLLKIHIAPLGSIRRVR